MLHVRSFLSIPFNICLNMKYITDFYQLKYPVRISLLAKQAILILVDFLHIYYAFFFVPFGYIPNVTTWQKITVCF